MTIKNIENHMAYTCKCGGVNFALLKSGGIECNKCSTLLDDVKWWAGGMGAQLARAIKAEGERDALKAASSQPASEQAAVQAGWKLVPVEPTPEMCRAAVIFANGNVVYKNVAAAALEIEESIYGETYQAMLAAAPEVK